MNESLTVAIAMATGSVLVAMAVRKVTLILVRRKLNQHRVARIDQVAYRDVAWLFNAGIVGNLIWSSATLGVSQAITGHWPIAIVLCGLAAACWFWRRIVAAYVLPALAVSFLILIAWDIPRSLSGHTPPIPHLGDIFDVGGSDGLTTMVVAGIASLLLAVTLTIPVFTADNGKAFNFLLTRRFGSKATAMFQVVSIVLVLGFAVLNIAWAVSTSIS